MVGSQRVFSKPGSGGPRPPRVTALLARNPEQEGAHAGIRQTPVENLQNKVGTLAALLSFWTAEPVLLLLPRTQLIM